MKHPSNIEIGVITGPHGLRGEVSYHPHNVDSDLPFEGMTVYVRLGDQPQKKLVVDYVRPKPKARIVAFFEVEDRAGAELLRGARVEIDEGALPKAKRGEFYYRDVIGKPVTLPDNTVLGVVTDIFSTDSDILVIDHHGREWMIPVVARFIRDIGPSGVVLEPSTLEEVPPE